MLGSKKCLCLRNVSKHRLRRQVIGGIWLEGAVAQRAEERELRALQRAARLATEAVLNVRTVQSLGNALPRHFLPPFLSPFPSPHFMSLVVIEMRRRGKKFLGTKMRWKITLLNTKPRHAKIFFCLRFTILVPETNEVAL